MTKGRERSGLLLPIVGLIAALLVVPIDRAGAEPGDTTRVSLSSEGLQGNGHSGFGPFSEFGRAPAPAVSGDGSLVAFSSAASNLVAGDSNGMTDVFVRDRLGGATTRVSVGSGGGQGDGDSFNPTISADGRYVAFESRATNLVDGDANGFRDLFVRDLLAGTTTRLTDETSGSAEANFDLDPAISADGRYVAFSSSDNSLVPGDNGSYDVFVHDRDTGTIELVSASSAGTKGSNNSFSPAISADGRFLAFLSVAGNLVAGDTNGGVGPDVFVRDRQSVTTTRVNVDSTGAQADDGVDVAPAISADGRYVAFSSNATNLVPGDTNAANDIFVHDRTTGATTRVSVDSVGNQADDHSSDFPPAISADGRYVTFQSRATNLVAGDTNLLFDVFLHDRATAATTLVSVDSAGNQANSASFGPALSADGSVVAFPSRATNLVPDDTNGVDDVFVHEVGSPNLPPVANDDAATTEVDVAVSVEVLANDTDADGDFLSVSANTVAGNGTVDCDGFQCTYTPAPGFAGTDSFTYTVDDGRGGTDTATVRLTVGPVPCDIAPGLVTDSLAGGGPTAEQLASALASGDGVTVDNVVYTGADVAAGTFDCGEEIIGFESGVMLSSGAIRNAVGPNQDDGITDDNGTPGDSALTELSSDATFDAAILEFDVVPDSELITFDYVFASDEYNEFVYGEVNDVFAFFVNGVNCATIPETGDAVSIDTVNGGNPFGTDNARNPSFFRNNDLDDGGGSINTEMDGLTVALNCPAEVTPGVANRLRLAIADGGDSVLDSNVFLRAGSLASVGNNPPDALDDTIATEMDVPGSVDVLVNDTDPNGDPLTVIDFTQGASGAVACEGSVCTYTPGPGFVGSDSFTYSISDGRDGTDTATVNVTVEPDECVRTLTVGDPSTTDGAVRVTVDGLGAFGSASAYGGDAVFNPVGPLPSSGTVFSSNLFLSGLGLLASNCVDGQDVEVVEESPSSLVTRATLGGLVFEITQTVAPTDEGSVLNQTYRILNQGEATTLALVRHVDGDLLFDGSLIDGGAATLDGETLYEFDSSDDPGAPSTFVGISGDLEGAATPDRWTLQPFDYRGDIVGAGGIPEAHDGQIVGDTDGDRIIDQPYDVTLSQQWDAVLAAGDAVSFTTATQFGRQAPNQAPIANDDDAGSTEAGTPVSIDVLANDTDPDGDPLTITSNTQGTRGTVACVDGVCTYRAAAGFAGTDTFTYTIDDGRGGTDTATVTVVVVEGPPDNQDPVAVDDSIVTRMNTPGSVNVLLNDSDPDGDPFTVASNTDGANGTAACAATGDCTYTPDAGFMGPDTFTYTIGDGREGTDTATVNVTVQPPPGNRPPIANDDLLATDVDTPGSVDVLANDIDPDIDPLTVTANTAAGVGTAVCDAGGICTYIPADGFTGDDTFSYTVSDGQGGTDTALVNVTVGEGGDGNQPPVAEDDVLTVESGTPGSVEVLLNDFDPDGDTPLRIIANSDGQLGTVECEELGPCTYISHPFIDGEDNFTYTISDGRGGTDTGNVVVNLEQFAPPPTTPPPTTPPPTTTPPTTTPTAPPTTTPITPTTTPPPPPPPPATKGDPDPLPGSGGGRTADGDGAGTNTFRSGPSSGTTGGRAPTPSVVDAPSAPTTALPVSPGIPLPAPGPVDGRGLVLERPSATSGGQVVVMGQGCEPGSEVVVRVGDVLVGTTTADYRGAYRSEMTLPELAVGRHELVSTCGGLTTRAPLDIVLATASGGVGNSATVGVVLCFFVLLSLLLRTPQEDEPQPRRS